jgi:hypothetical protein
MNNPVTFDKWPHMQRKSGYLLAVILLTSTSCAQPIVNLPVPLAISECEYFTSAPPCRLGMGNKAAGIWTFEGQQGKAVWIDPSAIVQLSVQRFDTGAVIINRRDPSGLTAVYRGTIQGNTMSGMEDWKLPNGFAGQSKWYAQIGSAQEQQAEVAQQHQAEQQILAAQQQRQQYNASSAGMGGLGALFMGLAGAAAMMPSGGSGDYDGPSERDQDAARQRDIRMYDSRNPQNAY